MTSERYFICEEFHRLMFMLLKKIRQCKLGNLLIELIERYTTPQHTTAVQILERGLNR